MESRMTSGSDEVRNACHAIDCTVESVFFTRWFNSSMSIFAFASSCLYLVRSTSEMKCCSTRPVSSRTGLMKMDAQHSLPSLRR